jgi:pseudouridine-5'-monophosphatase
MNYPHPIHGIIFDNDGCLLDTEHLYEIVFERLTGHVDKEFRRQLQGLTGPDACALIVKHYGMDEDPLHYQARRDAELQKIFPAAQLFPGAEEVVAYALSRNLPIALATSSNRDNFVTKIVNHDAFYKQFHSIICGDEIVKGKPNPEIFLKSMAAIGVGDPKNCLVFEDAPLGVKAANNAGMPVVMIPDPELPLENALAETGAVPTVLWKSLKEPDWSMFRLEPKGAIK